MRSLANFHIELEQFCWFAVAFGRALSDPYSTVIRPFRHAVFCQLLVHDCSGETEWSLPVPLLGSDSHLFFG